MISVVIPVYNGQNYITYCLNSIIKQTYKNYEVIIVDDGSTDDSKNAIIQFLSQHESTRYRLLSQVNQGQGAARNTGLYNSTGKYVVFVDQDDYLEVDFFSVLIKKIEEEDYDVVISGYRRVSENKKTLKTVPIKDTEWSKYSNITPWGKIYRRSFLIENHIEYLRAKLGKDIYFSIQVYTKTDRIKTIDYVGYCWVYNTKSLSNTAYRLNSLALIPLFNQLVKQDNFEEWRKNPYCEYFLFKTIVWFILYTASCDKRKNHYEICQYLYQWMERYFPNYRKNPYIGLFRLKGEKFYLLLIVFCYWLAMKMRFDKAFIYMISGWNRQKRPVSH